MVLTAVCRPPSTWHRLQSHTCRCCGRVYDLEDTDGHVLGSICPVCYWEEDNSEEFAFSCANGMPLDAYRKAYFDR